MNAATGVVRRYGTERLELGEGARWVGDSLYLVDLLAGRLLVTAPAVDAVVHEVCRVNHTLGAVAPLAGKPGAWVAAVGDGVALITADDELQWLDRPELSNPIPMRMNDAAVDPSGRFWVGSMAIDGTPDAGHLYRVDNDGSVRAVVDGLSIPNGPAFSSDGRQLYLADSAKGRIDRLDIDPASGDVLSQTTFVQLTERGQSPDGMTVDAEGCLWVAIWGGSVVHRYTADGQLDTVLAVPARQPTSVCFGGQNGRQLFITSAYVGLLEPSDGDGAVFVSEANVAGNPARAAVLT